LLAVWLKLRLVQQFYLWLAGQIALSLQEDFWP